MRGPRRTHQDASARAGGHNAASGHRVPRATVERGARRAHTTELVQVCRRPLQVVVVPAPLPLSSAFGQKNKTDSGAEREPPPPPPTPLATSILLGASSLSLVITYPLMKRITYWPQAVLGTSVRPSLPLSLPALPKLASVSHIKHTHTELRLRAKQTFCVLSGLAFNWGALLGWSAVSGAVHWPVAGALYAGGVFWTLVYDSIYAHQDKTDDVLVGIRSTALLFGEHTRSILAAFSASSVGCITLAGYLNAQGVPFFLGTGFAAAQLARVIHRTDFDDRESCGRGFIACGWAGFCVWVGALGDYVWSRLGSEEEPSFASASK